MTKVDDAISRRSAINTVMSLYNKCDTLSMDDYRDMLIGALEVLPPTHVEAIEGLPSIQYHDPFGNPIYVYVRVGDKTVAIKADDLQKALDYVTKHGEEVTIEGRRTDERRS